MICRRRREKPVVYCSSASVHLHLVYYIELVFAFFSSCLATEWLAPIRVFPWGKEISWPALGYRYPTSRHSTILWIVVHWEPAPSSCLNPWGSQLLEGNKGYCSKDGGKASWALGPCLVYVPGSVGLAGQLGWGQAVKDMELLRDLAISVCHARRHLGTVARSSLYIGGRRHWSVPWGAL